MIVEKIKNSPFGVVINNFDILTDEMTINLPQLVLDNTVVVFKKQKCIPEVIVKVSSYCGSVSPMDFFTHPNFNEIALVTGQKNSKGENIGVFGKDQELGWHCNKPASFVNEPFVALHAIENTKGTKTIWMDLNLLFNDLPEDLKEEIKMAKGFFFFNHEVLQLEEGFNKVAETTGVLPKSNWKPLYFKLPNGRDAFFFPWLFCDKINGTRDDIKMKKIISNLVENNPYQYQHFWEDGDLVISDQLTSLHRRAPYENIEKRLLYRTAFGWNNFYGDRLPFWPSSFLVN